jgi:hypothetical protein
MYGGIFMKRLSLALAAIGFSGSIFAALPAATDPTVVNVPLLDGGFVIGVSGYYLQPSPTHGDLDYASANPNTTTPFSSSLRSVDPGYDWGWGANIGYIFPQTGNDINLSYFSLSTSDTNSVALPALDQNLLITPIGIVTDALEAPNIASSKAEYDINQVDLTAGQFINVGCRLRLHPSVGLRWASIDRKLNNFYTEPVVGTEFVADGDNLSANQKSDFDGIGPLTGLDASYYLGMGFGVVAHIDSALLIGSINSSASTTYIEATGAIINSIDNNTFNLDSSNRLVPVVDAKLGLDYSYLFNNAANSDLTLEVGWQADQYYNAIDKIEAAAVDVDSDGDLISPGQINERTTSRLGLSGPYATLTLHV